MCNQKGRGGQNHHHDQPGGRAHRDRTPRALVDFDPQGSLSVGLGGVNHPRREHLQPTAHPRPRRHTTSPSPSVVDGLDILPANIDLSAAEVQLVSEVAREQTLKRVLTAVRRRLRHHSDRLCAVPWPIDGQCADRRRQGDHAARMRVLRAARHSPCSTTPSARCKTGSTPNSRSWAFSAPCTTRPHAALARGGSGRRAGLRH